MSKKQERCLNDREVHDVEREGDEGKNGSGILEAKSKVKNGETAMKSEKSNAKGDK